MFLKVSAPPFFGVSVNFAKHVLVGVMVDLEALCLPAATTLDGCGATWGWGSTFLVILVPSSKSLVVFQLLMYRSHMETT